MQKTNIVRGNMDYGIRPMRESERKELSQYIEQQFGIRMPAKKKTLLESRLAKRLRALQLQTYGEYIDFLLSNEGSTSEMPLFIDLISTHKTDFFREPRHYEQLIQVIIPGLVSDGIGIKKTCNIWSAACSTGEEPYSFAMILEEFILNNNKNFMYQILGTDISVQVLNTAYNAIYKESLVEPIPEYMKKRYLLRSKDESQNIVRIVPEIRKKVRFRKLNLNEKDYNLKYLMDIIILRNILIYFEKNIQEEIISRIISNLAPGGYLIIGHSESIFGMQECLSSTAPTVYRKKGY